MSTDRKRQRYTFWLDVSKPEQRHVATLIQQLKKRRGFASAIRDGLQLVNDLRRGKVDVLLEMFPWIADYFSTSSNSSVLEERLERMEALLSQRETRQDILPGAVGRGRTYEPAGDEDDQSLITVKKAEDDGEQSVQNFLNSLMALGG